MCSFSVCAFRPVADPVSPPFSDRRRQFSQMANDESKCVPQKWFALNFLQKSSFFALSSCLCWCIEALRDFLRLHQIIQFSFCVPNSASSSSFLWVDRNLLTYANRELFTLPEKSNNLPQWNFSPTPVFGCVYSLTHLQRFVCLECLCNWLNISTLLSSFDSQSKQGAKLAHTIQRWWMFLHVSDWREFEREIRQKTGLLIMIQIW
jgi:hypothetical protein